jgi:hypothetical protein
MWKKILKTQETVSRDKVGFWKPKTEIRSVQDNDEKDCCQEAKNKWKIFVSGSIANYDKSRYCYFPEQVCSEYSGVANDSCEVFKQYLIARKNEMAERYKSGILEEWKECEKGV